MTNADRDQQELADMRLELSRALDTIDGLRSELSEAVSVAYQRGAVEWTRLNYPIQYKRIRAAERENRAQARRKKP